MLKKSFLFIFTVFLINFGLLSATALASNLNLNYDAHVADIGWMDPVSEGSEAGTTGLAKSLEALTINSSEVEYQAHCTNIGWEGWKTNGQIAGTTGRALSLQAIQVRLTGEAQNNYDIYYRVHSANIGWLDWAKNGEIAGTTGCDTPAEAYQIVLVEKGANAPGSTENPNFTTDNVRDYTQANYRVSVKNSGWTSTSVDGEESGTTGLDLPIYGVTINIPKIDNGIEYRTFIKGTGWTNWVSNSQVSGDGSTEDRYVQGIQIRLKGTAKALYDVYYQTHNSNYGWLGWAKNGEKAGTLYGNSSMQSLKVILMPKFTSAPGSTANYLVEEYPSRNSVSPTSGSLIYVSVPYQRLFYYKDGQMIFQCDCATGQIGKSDSPRGTWHITSKQRQVYITGPDYHTLVQYWIPYIGKQYGIHDSYWRSEYGDHVNETNGSGGCINLTYENCTTLFNLISVGDAITVQ